MSASVEVPPAIASMPRFRLLDGPSPLHRLPRFAEAVGGRVDVWMKREDLLPIAFGGNKLRNLEFLFGAALAEGADTVITSGRRWSNHCRLTAAAGARAGLAVHLVLGGPPGELAGSTGPMLDELLGATVHVTASAAREDREALVERVRGEVAAEGRRPFVIGVGGSGRVGYAGQVLAGIEVAEQAAALAVQPAAIVVPSATGGTQAGVLAGLRLAGATSAVVGVAAAHGAEEVREAVLAALAEIEALTGLSVGADEVHVDGSQLGDGYGFPTAAAGAATRLLGRSEGILVDPIYTAKGLAGLVAGVTEGRWDGRTVVFWHAGGLPGLFEPLPGRG